jgi:hypothetical protein
MIESSNGSSKDSDHERRLSEQSSFLQACPVDKLGEAMARSDARKAGATTF